MRHWSRASFRCGLLSVRREAASRVAINCWYQRRCGAAGVHLTGRGVRTGSRCTKRNVGLDELRSLTQFKSASRAKKFLDYYSKYPALAPRAKKAGEYDELVAEVGPRL